MFHIQQDNPPQRRIPPVKLRRLEWQIVHTNRSRSPNEKGRRADKKKDRRVVSRTEATLIRENSEKVISRIPHRRRGWSRHRRTGEAAPAPSFFVPT